MTITGASEIIPGLFRDKGGAVINVKHPDFGAVGDGVTDDTAAIQAALNYYSGTGWNGAAWGNPTRSGRLVFPDGVYLISSTLTYNGGYLYNIVIEGSSGPAGATTGATIRWNGSAGGTMFYAQGMCRSVIRDLAFDGAQASHNVLYCVQIDGKNITQAGSPGSTQVLIDRVACRVGTFASSAGIAIGHTGSNDQIDTIVIRDPYLTGASTTTTAGILFLSGGNTTQFTITGGTITSFGYAVKAPNVGVLACDGTTILVSTVADFYFTGAPTQLLLRGVHSEQGVSALFVKMDTSGGPSYTHIDGCWWHGVAPADDVFIYAHGLVDITGGDFENTRTGATIPKVYAVNPRTGPSGANLGGIRSRGAFYLNADNTSALWPFADSGGNRLAVGLTGIAGTFYDLFALAANFSSEGDYGGTRGTMIPLLQQSSFGGNKNFTKLRSVSNDAMTDVAADATIGLKKGDALKFKSNGGLYTDADVNGLSKNSDDSIQVGGSLGIKTNRVVGKANTLTYSASMTPDATLGNAFTITATNGTAFTINAPTTPVTDQELTVTLRNTSGGALGAATWNAVFKMAAWTNPATANSRSIRFRYDGTNWVELTRTTTDIPN